MPASPIGDPLNRTAITLGVLVTLAVVLRFLARWRSKADFAADDVLIAISVLPQYVMIVFGAEGISDAFNLFCLRLTSNSGQEGEAWDYLLRHIPRHRYHFC